MAKPLRLGINVDHVATIRNARGWTHPDPVAAARIALAHGADGITAHLREDRRHIRDADIAALKALPAPLNFEMAATDEMVDIALATLPHAVCLVPERRTEVTTEGGLDLIGQGEALRPVIETLTAAGIRVSLFIDPDPGMVALAADLGAPVIELHTGDYCHARTARALDRLIESAALADRLGIECHAGHGLDYETAATVSLIETIAELNIGHFLIGQAVFEGLGPAVERMKALMRAARG